MKQLLQSYRSGRLDLVEVPSPTARPGHLLVRTAASLVSVGTERYMLELARKSLLGKALARPDWVKQVVDKVRTEGPLEAYRQAMAQLDASVPLGCSSAGVVIHCGLRVGSRVAATQSPLRQKLAGRGFAP